MAKVKLPKPKILAISLPALVVTVAMIWLTNRFLAGQPAWLVWTVRGLIVALVGVAFVLVVKLFKGSGPPAARAEPDAVDGLVDQAIKRLNAIGVRGRKALAGMPIVLVLGPRGSAKTTFVARSDLDVDQLAGNLLGESVVPTDAVNVWYRGGQVLVEAGGQLSVDPARWGRLLDLLKPRKLLPAFLGRPQAPRVAVVCFSVEDLLATGSGDSHLAAARTLRARLTEMAERIGIRLPVYVVFTKTDRVPHFEEFAKNLTDAEVHELLGVTLRTSGDAATGSYAERESERLSRAAEELFHGLVERRLELLSRSGATPGNGAAYEFPREFRKLSRPAIQFLVELCRPSQLRVSPFLRGFYFSGVRPVVARGDAPQGIAPAQAFGQPAPAGATQVFRLDDLQAHAARAAAPGYAQERRVPQWVFLDGILKRVVLMDRVAMGITGSGVGLAVLRRGLMAGAIGALLFLCLLTVIAYGADNAMQREARLALEGVADLSGTPASLSSAEPLQRLDSLRAVAQKLSAFEHEGRPIRSKLFMYSGERLYQETRRAYFHLFQSALFPRAFEVVKSDLRNRPLDPTSAQFDRLYGSLKAYVEVTDPLHHDSATAEFFGPTLTERWVDISAPDQQVRDLLQSQFAFYGEELPHGSPFAVEAPDLNLLNEARAFLTDKTTDDSFYERLLGEWDRLPPARLGSDRSATLGYLRPASDVHGAYTRAGWDSVRATLSGSGQTFSIHVVGPDFFQKLTARGFEFGTLASRLQTRYEESYRDEWLRFLSEIQLESRPLQQAQDWLNQLGAQQSPLFQLFAYVDSQTSVGAPVVDSAFASLAVLTGPDTLRVRISEKPGFEYLDKLRTLALAVGDLSAAPGPAAGEQVRGLANAGTAFVNGIFVNFPAVYPGALQTSTEATRLLRQPFAMANQFAGGTPALVANGKAEAFCSQWGPQVLQKYPFRQSAVEEASLAEVAELLDPRTGALSAYFAEIAQSGATLTPEFTRFRNTARAAMDTLFSSGDGARLRIGLRVIGITGNDRVDVWVGGQQRTFTDLQRETQGVTWDGGVPVRLDVQIGGRSEQLNYGGPWALFRFFEKGRWPQPGAAQPVVTWSTAGGATVTAEVYGGTVLNPAFFAGFSCPRVVAR
jgi:type VI secretion system protein ImpL